jgi:bacterial/archaeal transporter family-2 protein
MIWALLATVAGGVALAVQAPINGRLAAHAGDSMAATAISFGVGFALLVALTAARGAIPAPHRLVEVPWWAWLGGVLGAFYVWSALWSVGILGVVTLMAALILGQMTAALVLDATGAFGLTVREISPQRILAAVLVAAGVILSRL